jgi:hypothetical protein
MIASLELRRECGVELLLADFVPDEKCGSCSVLRRCFAQGLRGVGNDNVQDLRDAPGELEERDE